MSAKRTTPRAAQTATDAPKRLGRPREFDEDEVLDAAMETFWCKGFEASSMADLLAATGLHKGSLYKAFGDKRSLFLMTVRRYFDKGYSMLTEAIAAEADPRPKLEAWMGGMLGSCGSVDRRGCYAINVQVELAPHDEEIADLVAAQFARVQALITDVIVDGQKTGVFRSDRKADELAEFLMVFNIGAVTHSKGRLAPERALKLAESALGAVLR